MNNFIDDPLKLYIIFENIFSIDLCKMILKYSSMGVHNAQKTFYLKSFFCNLQNAKILHHRIFKYLHSIEHPLQPPSNFNFINSSIFVWTNKIAFYSAWIAKFRNWKRMKSFLCAFLRNISIKSFYIHDIQHIVWYVTKKNINFFAMSYYIVLKQQWIYTFTLPFLCRTFMCIQKIFVRKYQE